MLGRFGIFACQKAEKVTMAQDIAAVSKPEGGGQFGPPPMTNYS